MLAIPASSILALLAVQSTSLAPEQVITLSQQALEYSGWSVALSGDTLASGAPSGNVVYVFVEQGAGWLEQARLVPPPGFAGGSFGQSVDLDGDTLVVGAPGPPGKAFVYRRSGSTWSLEGQLIGPGGIQQQFGTAVAVSGDTAVVGSPDIGLIGAVFLFTRSGANWSAGTSVVPTLAAPTNRYGESLALEGGTLLVGSPVWNALHPVHVFAVSGSQVSQQAVLSPPPGTPVLFGRSLALLGDEAVVGAEGYFQEHGVAHVYGRSGSSWTLQQTLTPSGSLPGDGFAKAVALGPDLLVAGAPAPDGSFSDTEAVYGFRRTGSGWSEAFQVDGPYPLQTDKLGSSLAIRGQTVACGAPYSGLGPYFGQGSTVEYVSDLGGLVAIDSARNAVLVGPLPDSVPLAQIQGPYSYTGLAHDPANGALWGSHQGSDELWRIDPTTWVATLVGTLGLGGIQALAHTPYGLYALDNATDQLVAVATGTAVCTPIGSLGFDTARGLAWDPDTETLYACSKSQLFTLDRLTGAATLLGDLGGLYDSLTFDPVTDALLGLRDSVVWEIDPITLEQTAWDPIHLLSSGSVYMIDAGLPLPYCTAGTSASGCVAQISGSGTPSATAPSGFDLVAAGVEGAKRGLFFYGSSGRQAAPWGNSSSFQCVVTPVRRTTLLQETGTSGLCDGLHAFDLNAWFQAKPGSSPGAGQLVQAQFWYRDPFAATSVKTSLSDALEFALAP